MIQDRKVQQYLEGINPEKLGLVSYIGKPEIAGSYSGESNRIYFVNFDSVSFVLKINGISGKDPEFFKREYDKLRSLEEFEIAPRAFVYDEFSLENQSMILEMIEGETLKGKKVSKHLEQILTSLNRMVEVPADMLRRRKGFNRDINDCWDYVHMFPTHAQRQLKEYFDCIGRDSTYELCRQASCSVERKIDSQKRVFSDSKMGLIHTGLHPENIVYTLDGEIRFIDWEHSSVGDRAFEISSLIRSNDFSEEEIERIFYTYQGQTGDFLPRVNLYTELFKVHEVLWHALRYDKARKGQLNLSEERDADYYKELLERHIENLNNSNLI